MPRSKERKPSKAEFIAEVIESIADGYYHPLFPDEPEWGAWVVGEREQPSLDEMQQHLSAHCSEIVGRGFNRDIQGAENSGALALEVRGL